MNETRRKFLQLLGIGVPSAPAIGFAVTAPVAVYKSQKVRSMGFTYHGRIRDKNVLHLAKDYTGAASLSFRSIPIRIVDSLP